MQDMYYCYQFFNLNTDDDSVIVDDLVRHATAKAGSKVNLWICVSSNFPPKYRPPA